MSVCKYNAGVGCDVQYCKNCGWNPEVAQRRRDACVAMRKATKNPQQGRTKSKRVAKVDAHGQVVEIYSSIGMAAAVNHVSRTTVRNRCEDAVTQFAVDLGGFTFRYLKD